MGQHQQPQRVPAAARRRGRPGGLHLHAAQPQLPAPPPLLRRRARRLPARPLRRRRRLRRGRRHPRPRRGLRRRRLPQCRGGPGAVFLPLRPRRRPRAPRRRRRARRAGARDVPRPRRRRLGRRRRELRPPEEAHDQEPRVRRALPRAQAGLRPRAGEGGEAPAAGEPEPPRQVRAAEGVRGGAGEEDAAEVALRAILSQEQIEDAGCRVPSWW